MYGASLGTMHPNSYLVYGPRRTQLPTPGELVLFNWDE
jgi:hypothetical protein